MQPDIFQALNSSLILIPQHFGSIIYIHHTSRYLAFDIESTNLLINLKSRSLHEILHEVQDSQDRIQISNFFEHFNTHDFFSIDQKFVGTVLDVVTPPDHLVGPLTLHLEVTDSCNLKCKHCFAGKIPRNEQALNLDELDVLFASMKNMGTFRLGLTGGEPLLRDDLFEIVDQAIEHGLSPCLTTNGLLITDDIACELGKRKFAWLNVSLEGACPQTHDYIRGRGTFSKVLDKLVILSKHTRFSLAFTVIRSNLHELKACVELAYRVGAEAAVFRPLYPVGTAQQHPELMPTFSEYMRALNELSNLKDINNGSFQFCNIHPWGPQTRLESQSLVYENFGCGAGNTVCSVSVSGDVSPCSFLSPKYIAGNIRKNSLEDIWHNSSVFKNIRSLIGNQICLNCRNYESCGGGCRARALILNKSINAPDPWCTSKYNKEYL
ncbi:MAG: radical SAM protein [Candidatus Hodarchaeota archaeon]